MNKKTVIIGALLIVILAVGVGVFVWKNEPINEQELIKIQEEENKNTDTSKNNQTVVFEDLFNDLTSMKVAIPDMADWAEYRNATMGFSIKIPSDWYAENSNSKSICIKSKIKKFYFEGGESCGVVVSKYSEDDFVRFVKMSKNDNELKYINIDSKKILYMSGYFLPMVAVKNKDVVWEVSIQGADNSIENEILYGIINSMGFE